MADDVLNVVVRDSRGKRNAKRMRRDGKIPAILYGHGKKSISLSVDAGEVLSLLRRNAQLVQLKGAASDSALFKDVQYDALGSRLLHIDFTRVDADEIVTITVEVQLRGVAPGTKQGGLVDHQTHSIEVDCPASEIPEGLQISINELELGQSLTAGQIELPPKVKLHGSPDMVIASCVEPTVAPDEEEVAPSDGAEPEVIGAKPEDSEGDDE